MYGGDEWHAGKPWDDLKRKPGQFTTPLLLQMLQGCISPNEWSVPGEIELRPRWQFPYAFLGDLFPKAQCA